MTQGSVLSALFFERPAPEVARKLLGAFLVCETNGRVRRCKITETEAYEGEEDRANHASRGRTKRTEVMYGPAGMWYVYLCYGMHNMLNVVTGAESHPAAVLIRGTEEISGPGRLTRDLGITREFYGHAAAPENGLWLERGESIPDSCVSKLPRVGVDYAGEWAKKEWRFLVKTENG